MPTLNEITEAHSKRLSRITQTRDSRLRDAVDTRDRDLRTLPAAARLYEAFDEQIADARGRQRVTAAKAEAVRTGALQEVSDTLAAALEEAQRVRRDADVAAFEKRRQAEEEAEHEFVVAIGAAAQPASSQAQGIRAERMAKARKEFDAALAAAQQQFRASRDAALVAESRGSREADRAFAATSRVGEASSTAARAAAEQELARALAAIPAAAAEFAEWRKETALIIADYKKAENEEFGRFHREVRALEG
jgi:uncharacterized protein YfiM (DUF2279 family)